MNDTMNKDYTKEELDEIARLRKQLLAAKRELAVERMMYVLVTKRLAESLISSLKRCNKLAPETDIKTLIPSVDGAIYEAESASLAHIQGK